MMKGSSMEKIAVVGEKYCGDGDRELTVRKTSLFYPGDGFAAYDPISGELVFRVDSYGPATPALAEEIVLMDPAGSSILTLRRRWPSLHHRWEAFLGDRADGQPPLFTIKRPSIFSGARGNKSCVEVEVHSSPATFQVEGSFAQRSCRVVRTDTAAAAAASAGSVAEVRRKVDTRASRAQVVLGRDVFCLKLGPGCDAAFAMGIVLVLDRIDKEEPEEEEEGGENGGATEVAPPTTTPARQQPLRTIGEILSSDTDHSD